MENKAESYLELLSGKLWVPVVVFILIATSCEYKYIEPQKTSPIDTTVVISFLNDIQPIFDGNCTTCHPSAHPLDLTSGNSYDQLLNSGPNAPYIDAVTTELSTLYIRLTSTTNPMPPSGNIPQNDIDLVLNWIQQGGKNN